LRHTCNSCDEEFRVGHIYTGVKFTGIRGENKLTVLVDTGATFSILPPQIADQIGVSKLPRKIGLHLANSNCVEAEAGSVLAEVKGREVPATVVILPGSESILGVETLEGLGLKVNPKTGGIEPQREWIARA
jgi:clan AA aspartic protease